MGVVLGMGAAVLLVGTAAREDRPMVAADRAYEAGDIDALLDLLVSTSRKARFAAAVNLGKLRSERAVDPLLQRLHSTDNILRAVVVGALGRIGDPRAADEIYGVGVNNSSNQVCAAAADALLALGDRQRALTLYLLCVRGGDETVDRRVPATGGLVGLAERVFYRLDPGSYRSWALGRLINIGAVEAIPRSSIRTSARSAAGA